MSTIIVCRHGNTFDPCDIVTRVGGRTDLPLSETGVEQARRLASHFAETEICFSDAYSSDLKRTRQTAALILSSGQHSVSTPETLGFLREIDYGPDENRSEADVISRIGPQALEDWDQSAILPPGWKLDTETLLSNWRSFFADHRQNTRTVLVVTSNGIARFLFAALDIPVGDRSIKLKTGAYGTLVEKDSRWTMTSWNVRP